MEGASHASWRRISLTKRLPATPHPINELNVRTEVCDRLPAPPQKPLLPSSESSTRLAEALHRRHRRLCDGYALALAAVARIEHLV